MSGLFFLPPLDPGLLCVLYCLAWRRCKTSPSAISQNAEVAELVDALDLGSSGAIRGGSSPPFRIVSDKYSLKKTLGPGEIPPFSFFSRVALQLPFHPWTHFANAGAQLWIWKP